MECTIRCRIRPFRLFYSYNTNATNLIQVAEHNVAFLLQGPQSTQKVLRLEKLFHKHKYFVLFYSEQHSSAFQAVIVNMGVDLFNLKFSFYLAHRWPLVTSLHLRARAGGAKITHKITDMQGIRSPTVQYTCNQQLKRSQFTCEGPGSKEGGSSLIPPS